MLKARSDNQLSCCLLSLHFLCDILRSRTVLLVRIRIRHMYLVIELLARMQHLSKSRNWASGLCPYRAGQEEERTPELLLFCRLLAFRFRSALPF